MKIPVEDASKKHKYYLTMFRVTALYFIKFFSKMSTRFKCLINFMHTKVNDCFLVAYIYKKECTDKFANAMNF